MAELSKQEIKEALEWLKETGSEAKARKYALLYAFKQTGKVISKRNIRKLDSKEVEEWSRVYREGLKLYQEDKLKNI